MQPRRARRSSRVATLAATLVLALFASACTHIHVLLLADEAYGGRVPGTTGHENAGNYLISYLKAHGVEAMDGTTTTASYRDDYGTGTNIVGRIPGTDLASEIVIVGAHYDHLNSCQDVGGTSTCNGATDNAAGSAIVLEMAAALFDSPTPPRRTVVFGFWDQEESGLVGSGEWVAANPALIADTVAYVNYDIQGANLLPSLREETLAVGAETGGAVLEAAVAAAGATEPLNLHLLSLIFGQGRSDHVNFTAAGVPTVFFTDATGPCYHTTRDDYSVLDSGKIGEQTAIGVDLVSDLAAGLVTPIFTAAPLGTYDDAVVIDALVQAGIADLGLFSPADQVTMQDIATEIAGIVAAGPGSFDAAALNTLFLNSLTLVSLLENGTTCDGFLE